MFYLGNVIYQHYLRFQYGSKEATLLKKSCALYQVISITKIASSGYSGQKHRLKIDQNCFQEATNTSIRLLQEINSHDGYCLARDYSTSGCINTPKAKYFFQTSKQFDHFPCQCLLLPLQSGSFREGIAYSFMKRSIMDYLSIILQVMTLPGPMLIWTLWLTLPNTSHSQDYILFC